MDWSKLPDLLAVGLLAIAFASAARRSHIPVSGHWLTGWLLIALHFAADVFAPLPGLRGDAAGLLALLSICWAGILFMRAAVPYRKEISSRAMLLVLLCTYTLYVSALAGNAPHWILVVSALAMGIAPLAVAVAVMRRFTHVLRWVTAGMQCVLSVVLLLVQDRPNGGDLALNAALFTVYLSCSVHFWYMYRRATAGAFITISGFIAWASVFVAGPILYSWAPWKIESEVWNLPKYVVAVGMILLLLEDQIAHNKHLALHDALTGLPNRRLFQDRLASALARARRTGTQTALLTLDLDRFKQVNDTLGHHAGDLLLQGVAQLFSGRVRRSDTVARTGGDEFAVILDSPTSISEATHVGQSLLDLLKEPISIKSKKVHIGASLGIAVFPDDAEDMESLCITADLRMYDNKRANGLADDPTRMDDEDPADSRMDSGPGQQRMEPHAVKPPSAQPQTGLGLAQ